MTNQLALAELFAGYGGLGIAVENTLNAHTTWVAEWDDAPSKVLAARFPDVPNHRDVTTIDWHNLEPVDIISGGSPCQDISGAGRRAGMTEGTRSNLWVAMRHGISVHRPKYVVWENVRGALTAKASTLTDPDGKKGTLRALGRVLGDLTDLGYDVEWRGLRAADIGACHGRFRIFILATRRDHAPATAPELEWPLATWNTEFDYWQKPSLDLMGDVEPHTDVFPTSGVVVNGDAYARPAWNKRFTEVPLLRTPCAAEAGGGPLSPAQAKAQGRTLRLTGQVLDHFHPGILDGEPKMLPTPGANLGTNGGPQHPDKRRAGNHSVSIEDVAAFLLSDAAAIKLLPTPVSRDHKGNNHRQDLTCRPGALDAVYAAGTWGEYLPAVLRHALVFGMPDVPSPTEAAARAGGRPRLAAPFVEWMMALPPGWVTGVDLKRADHLKMLGNGVVPAQAEAALHDMFVAIGAPELVEVS